MQLLVFTAFLASFSLVDATGFLNPQHASLVAHTVKKEMPITTHSKKAGDGYEKGSPLFAKQEELEKKGKGTPASKAAAIEAIGPPGVKAPKMPSTYNPIGATPEEHVYRGLSAFLSYFIVTMLVALIWVKYTSPGRTDHGYDERKNNALGFAYNLFAWDHCFGHHASVCLCSWCCGPLRLADTYSKNPSPLVKSFWTALVLIACLIGLSQLTYGFTGVIFLCAVVYFRQGLRKKYGLESGGSTVAVDCLSWIFCPFCSMAQEARQVEFVLPVKRGPA